ncbi:F-box domain, partial [Arabidopsis suecica]
MAMEKNYNPNSWSELPLDLLISVFELLSFANFQRAKSVCSSWYSASRQVLPKNHIHWLILFPRDNNNTNNNKNSCTLFNPEEKDKLYKPTQDFGEEFAKSFCSATHGSWLLMQDLSSDLYIVNLFTHERINLPPSGLLWKDYEASNAIYQTCRFKPYCSRKIRSPVFWIDEKTKDYVVLWGLRDWCVFYSKKGDTSWNQIPQTPDCLDMVYKDHKLYFLSKTGKVLKVEKLYRERPRAWSFRVFEVYSSRFLKKLERRINSLGDESMLLDQGITVIANDSDGFNRNSIYFSDRYQNNIDDIFIFNLETRKTELLHTFDSYESSVQFSEAQ